LGHLDLAAPSFSAPRQGGHDLLERLRYTHLAERTARV